MTIPSQTLASSLPLAEQESKYLLHDEEVVSFLAAVMPRMQRQHYGVPCSGTAPGTASRLTTTRLLKSCNTFNRTTYFDSEDHALLRSARGKVARRLRLREYESARPGEQSRPTGLCYLEVKESASGRRTKHRTQIGSCERHHLLEHGLYLPNVGVLTPRLVVWYRRLSLASYDGAVRVTVDSDVTFLRPARGAVGPRVVGRLGQPILEVKQAGDAPGWLSDALQSLVRASGLSKFELGMMAVLRAKDSANTKDTGSFATCL